MTLLLLGGILGFMFWNFFAGKFEGDRPERSLKFSIGKYYLHIHHWVWSLVLIIILFALKSKFYLAYGFLIGSIIQGLKYGDWYYVFYREEKREEIYAKFKKEDHENHGH